MSNDFHRVEFGSQSAAKAGPRHSAGPTSVSPLGPSTVAPPNSVLVPIDQWNRLLGQLGNIHEAGQQLAEARERMGRAETENAFLKERIRDLRSRLEREQLEGNEPPAVPIDSPSQPDVGTSPARTLNVELRIPAWMTRRRRRR